MRSSSREIKGPRPSPLQIHKNSHIIRKPRTSSTARQFHQPVIIYIRSPKIIHTNARDFMALVQKLTGLNKTIKSQPSNAASLSENNSAFESPVGFDVLPASPLLSEIPLFAPTSADFLCSPRDSCRCLPESLVQSSQMINMEGFVSPSFFEAMKVIPEF